MWVLETESGSSGRAASALSHCTISPAPSKPQLEHTAPLEPSITFSVEHVAVKRGQALETGLGPGLDVSEASVYRAASLDMLKGPF